MARNDCIPVIANGTKCSVAISLYLGDCFALRLAMTGYRCNKDEI